MIDVKSIDQYIPVVLGKVEDLTGGDGTGFSDSGAGHKDEGGSINSAPYGDLPQLAGDY